MGSHLLLVGRRVAEAGVGTRRHGGIPWRFSGTPLRVSCPAPTLGQHTEEVLREVLGLSGAEIDRLRIEGVLP